MVEAEQRDDCTIVGSFDTKIDPCGVPNCVNGDTSYLLNILSYERQSLWTQADYFLKKFPNRQGINVVHNATIRDGEAITLPVPVRPFPQFGSTGSNVIVLPDHTSKVLGHEVGHALGLPHVSDPLNLMCGRPPEVDPTSPEGLIDNFWCFSWTPHSIDADQLKTAKAKALTLVEK